MSLEQTCDWQRIDVFGGMSEEDYAKLPELYRKEVAELRGMAEDRNARHDAGHSVSSDEMDVSGARENEVLLTPMTLMRMRRLMNIVEANIHLLLVADQELVDEAQKALRAYGERPDLDRFSAERLTEQMIHGAGLMMAIGVEESVINGLKHGNNGDVRKRVWVRQNYGPEEYTIEVEDEGFGFKQEELPDPLVALGSGHGRGNLLTEEYSELVTRNERGNLVRILLTRAMLRERVLDSIRNFAIPPEEENKRAEKIENLLSTKYVPKPSASAEITPVPAPAAEQEEDRA